ncbi:MAG: hypothetical protein UHK60_01065 [Acutalibacteraceae bacterium]|nr:hypothetical protein [Acutalibacteraceae bacterium]
MLKKLKIRLVNFVVRMLGLLLIFGLFGVYYYNRIIKVNINYPVIEFKEDYKETVSVKSTDEELLEYVTATDVEDGDISKDVIVEQMSNLIEGNRREVVYSVCDSDNHVTKVTKEITYRDYTSPVIEPIEEEPVINERKYTAVRGCFRAIDVIDGDISNKIKIVSIDTSKGTSTRGVFPVTLTVTNSCGDVSYLESTVTFVGEEEED